MIELFADNGQKKDKEKDLFIEELYKEIGQLKIELDWLKKNLNLSVEVKVLLIEHQNKMIPVGRQAQLLGIARSTVYYEPRVDLYSLELMHLIDEEYTKTPFYGSRRIKDILKR